MENKHGFVNVILHGIVLYDFQGYLGYIKSLPINDTPEIFALHDNANITFAQNETFDLLDNLLMLQPKSSSGGEKSREEVRRNKRLGLLNICYSLKTN